MGEKRKRGRGRGEVREKGDKKSVRAEAKERSVRARGLNLVLGLLVLGFVISNASAWEPNKNLSSAADAFFLGEGAGDVAGNSVSGVGDVNGDGYDDFLIGAPGDGGPGKGKVYLILGNSAGRWEKNLSNASASFVGEPAGDLAGYSVSGAGDVNGDEFDDFLIGDCYNNEKGSKAGKVYLILGKETGWRQDTPLSTADASFLGESTNDEAGYSVSGAGDVDGDDCDDFLIGAPSHGSSKGKVYLILGNRTGWWDKNLSNASASFVGESTNDGAGWSVSGTGDCNSDGFDDFLIGAPKGGGKVGKAYLILGNNTGWWDENLSNASASFVGEAAGDLAGYSVSGAGDCNSDGFDDFLIGAPFNSDAGGLAGQVYLILGKSTGWRQNTPLATDADAFLLGDGKGNCSGWSVSGAGDSNGDYADDFLIAAPFNSERGNWAGKVYLLLGKPTFVNSSDDAGTEKNIFKTSESVYCYAGNLPASTTVKIFVVSHKPKEEWKAGDLLTDVSENGTAELATTNSSGGLWGGIWPAVSIWSSPLRAGDYNIVVDTNQNGRWDEGDPIDSSLRIVPVPAFPAVAFPLVAVLLLLALTFYIRFLAARCRLK